MIPEILPIIEDFSLLKKNSYPLLPAKVFVKLLLVNEMLIKPEQSKRISPPFSDALVLVKFELSKLMTIVFDETESTPPPFKLVAVEEYQLDFISAAP